MKSLKTCRIKWYKKFIMMVEGQVVFLHLPFLYLLIKILGFRRKLRYLVHADILKMSIAIYENIKSG